MGKGTPISDYDARTRGGALGGAARSRGPQRAQDSGRDQTGRACRKCGGEGSKRVGQKERPGDGLLRDVPEWHHRFFRHSKQSEGNEAGRPYRRLDPARRPRRHHAPDEGTGAERQDVEQCYYKQLGQDAEFVYSGSFWETSLQHPGNSEFVTAYESEFKRTPAVQSAGAYAACRLLADTVRRTGSLDSDKLREALLAVGTKTVLGDFAVDQRGFQTAHKAITIQWQDGVQVVVWPDDVISGKPRFPSPPWGQRR